MTDNRFFSKTPSHAVNSVLLKSVDGAVFISVLNVIYWFSLIDGGCESQQLIFNFIKNVGLSNRHR